MRRAADLMASALHASWFCGRPELVRETAATAARLAGSAGVDLDARLSAMTGAALTICERLDAAEPYLRRSIELATGAEPFVLAYAANSHGWLCEYRAARDARRPRTGRRAGAGSGGIGRLRERAALGVPVRARRVRRGPRGVDGHRARGARRPDSRTRRRVEPARSSGTSRRIASGDEEAVRLVDSARRAERPALVHRGGRRGLGARDGGARARRRRDGRRLLDEHRPRRLPGQLRALDGRRRPGRGVRARRAAGARHGRARRAGAPRAPGVGARRPGPRPGDWPRRRTRSTRRWSGPSPRSPGSACAWRRRAAASATANACGAPAAAYRPAPSCARRSPSSSACAARPGSSAPRASCGRAARRCAHAGREGPIDELTPQELQVATLAAAGLSNKEAAARLFLSVKTIEAHLHRTYRKLGVRSRAELAPLLAEQELST